MYRGYTNMCEIPAIVFLPKVPKGERQMGTMRDWLQSKGLPSAAELAELLETRERQLMAVQGQLAPAYRRQAKLESDLRDAHTARTAAAKRAGVAELALIKLRAAVAPVWEGRPGAPPAGDGTVVLKLTVSEWDRLRELKP